MKKVIFGVVVLALSAIARINAVDAGTGSGTGTGTGTMDTFKTEKVDTVKDQQKVDSMMHKDKAVNQEIKVMDQHGNEVVPEVSK